MIHGGIVSWIVIDSSEEEFSTGYSLGSTYFSSEVRQEEVCVKANDAKDDQGTE